MRGPLRLMIGVVAAGAVAWGGWRRQVLSTSGALGALVVGTPVFAVGGVRWAAPMVTFFVTSSALSKLGESRKAALQEVAAKGSRRDIGQVLERRSSNREGLRGCQ